MISNFLKRESSDTNTEVSVVPLKKKRKLTRGRSRKRQRPKIQRENSGHIVKKARKIELLSNSPEVEMVDENKNKDLQTVSECYVCKLFYRFNCLFLSLGGN